MIRSRISSSNNNNNNDVKCDECTKQKGGNAAQNCSTKSNVRRRGGNGGIGGGSKSFIAVISFVLITVVGIYLTGLYGMLLFVNIQTTNTGISTTPVLVSSSSSSSSISSNLSLVEAQKILGDIRRQFNDRYKVTGGKDDGNFIFTGADLLQKGLHTFGSIDYTARRLLDAMRNKRPFVFAFSGYSITVGRGNFFHQSFPFIVEEILKQPMQQLFGVNLIVRNAAIGGIPSFPYGFCMEHFLGKDPDIISWDYSMNEGGKDSSVLEAFIRQATKQLSKRPMIIMIDTNANRMKTLDEYTKRGWLHDAIAIGKKEIIDEKKIFDSSKTDDLPEGFKDWNEFGAPKNCPGRGSWHPKKQEHSMIGWIIAMHFVEAMDRAVSIIMEHDDPKKVDNDNNISLISSTATTDSAMPRLSKPISRVLPTNDAEVTDLLFGHQISGNDEYLMKELSCRTSFLPATDHEKTLMSVIVDGISEGDLDIMIDRTDDHYKKGWVLDVSKVERDTKRKVEGCGGLGYIDMKIALYGVPESGKLRLWLPFEGPSHDHHDHNDYNAPLDITARHWFDDFVICEANEKRDAKACKLEQDMEIIVGGASIGANTIHPIKGAAEYLKRTTCVNVGIPESARVTALKDVRTINGRDLSEEDKKKFGKYEDGTLGLVVDISAKSRVTRTDGACCLSHIVWEQH